VFFLLLMCICTSNKPESPAFNLQGTEYCACSNLRKAARAVTQLFDAALKPARIRSTQFALLVTIAKLAPLPLAASHRSSLLTEPRLHAACA